jgi:hypothetical protein
MEKSLSLFPGRGEGSRDRPVLLVFNILKFYHESYPFLSAFI